MRKAEYVRLANRHGLFASFFVLMIVGMSVGVSMAEPPAISQPARTSVPNRSPSPTEAAKLAADIEKTKAETEALNAISNQTRWWTTVLTAVGSIVGAIVGGIFTFVVTKMAQRFSQLQKELEDSRSERDRLRREDDEKLSRLKMRQEQEQAQELHNLRLFQDLGHQSHRARLAAAAVLLDRLRRLRGMESAETDAAGTAQLIGKVLVAVLKRQSSIADERTSDVTNPPLETSAESEASLRKYIADELVVTLGVRFAPGDRPSDLGKSPLGEGRDFQKCDLADVYWAYVDARGIDFFQSDFSQASLRGASLRETVFYEATLRNAILRGADLRNANLIGCDLRGADLREADLRGANLQGANLSGANLRDAVLEGAVINAEDVLRFRPTALPQGIDAFTGTRVMADVYRPAS